MPPASIKSHILPALAEHSLLSVGQFCDHGGCTATFIAHNVTVTKYAVTLLQGQRAANGLWSVPLATTDPPPAQPRAPEHHLNATIESSTLAEQIQFLHAACFSPTPSTWIQAINKGHFASWPGLTADAVRKHLPKSMATAQGHLDQVRRNQQSTKPLTPASAEPRPDPVLGADLQATPPVTDGEHTHELYAAILTIPSDTGQIYTDQCGRFPTTSLQGNKYIMVLYDYDSNAPLKNRSGPEILCGFRVLQQYLTDRGHKP
jgi:hypothetical protein